MRSLSRLLLFLLLAALCGAPAWSQAGGPVRSPHLEKKKDRLLVFGNGFVFGVREPAGWHGDTDNASSYGVNLLLYRPGTNLAEPEGVIRVRVNSKSSEDTESDLQVDMDDYRRRFPGIEFPEVAIFHPLYRALARDFTVPGQFHEYVAYINPGPQFRYNFSVALNTAPKSATDPELAALRAVVLSLTALQTR